MHARPSTPYTRAGPRVWALIREAYLAGLSAPTLAARFGVSIGAIRKRAGREGWTKAAAARAAPFPGAPGPTRPRVNSPPGAPLPGAPGETEVVRACAIPTVIQPQTLARGALARAAAALRDGEGLAALRLARAAEAIARLDDRLDLDFDDTPIDDDGREAMLRTYVRSIAVGLAVSLARGEPLPEGYADLAPDFAAAVADEGEDDDQNESSNV